MPFFVIRWPAAPAFAVLAAIGCGSASSDDQPGVPVDASMSDVDSREAGPTDSAAHADANPDGGSTGDAADGGSPRDASTTDAAPRDGAAAYCTGTPLYASCADCANNGVCAGCPGCASTPVGNCTGTTYRTSCNQCNASPLSCANCIGCTPQNADAGACTGIPSYASCTACGLQCHTCVGCGAGPLACLGLASCDVNDLTTCATIPGCHVDTNSCVGTPPACDTITSQAACTSGCYWVSSCVGTLTPCNQIQGGQNACPLQSGCFWEYLGTCAGTVTPCSQLDSTTCGSQVGCEWHPATPSCSGTPTPCDQLSTTECTTAPGCALEEGSPGSPADGGLTDAGCNPACGAGETCAYGVCVPSGLDTLPFDVVDARYSTTLDRIVVVSRTPPALHIYDPAARADVSVALPTAPTSVSIGPDGRKAAVGHDAHLSYVDLDAAELVGTFDVAAPLGNVVLVGNGIVYGLPSSDQWVNIHVVDVKAGMERPQLGMIYAGSQGALHPNGQAVYITQSGLGPSDLSEFRIWDGLPTGAPNDGFELYTSDTCGAFWITKDGLRLFDACGTLYTLPIMPPDVLARSLTYAGSLSGVDGGGAYSNAVVSLDDSPTRIAALIGRRLDGFATNLTLYEPMYLNPIDVKPMPAPMAGRFVFFRSDMQTVYVVAQAFGGPNGRVFGVLTY